MAILGRWTGGAVSILPGTAWAAPNGMFPTQDRNDGSAYGFNATTSTITLPSSGLADGYLLVAAFEFHDTSNGRVNPQGHLVQTSGSGTFVGGGTGGYSRDSSEDRSYVRCWAFVDSPSAAATFQFQWKRDTDAPTGGTDYATLEVIPLYYSDFGAYTSSDTNANGGTTPNQVLGFTGTDGANITLSSSTVTLSGDNKRYLCLGSQFYEGRNGRTQRWHGFRVDGVKEDAAKAYSYYRNAANDETGDLFTWLIQTSTSDVTIDQFCYLGDGVASGQGGADFGGSTPVTGDHAIVVLELHDTADVFLTKGSTNQNLATTGPVDIEASKVADVIIADANAFVRETDTEIANERAMDMLYGFNVSAASQAISTGQRWTGYAELTANGTEDRNSRAGDYVRNNQASQDTFGWSANGIGFRQLTADNFLGLSVTELAGSEGGGGALNVQAGWVGFWGLDLDTLPPAAGTDILSADSVSSATSVESPTVSQEHGLSGGSVSSASQLSTPAVGQAHVLVGAGLVAAAQVSTPSLSEAVEGAVSRVGFADLLNTSSLTTAYVTSAYSASGGANNCVVLCIAFLMRTPIPTTITVTYGGSAMTQVIYANNGANNDTGSAVFYLMNPPTGSQTTSITFDNDVRSCTATLIELSNVDDVDPVGNSAGANTGNTVSVTSSAAGSFIAGITTVRDGDRGPFSPTSDTTELTDVSTGSSDFNDHATMVGQNEATALSTSYTIGGTPVEASDPSAAAVEFLPVPSASGTDDLTAVSVQASSQVSIPGISQIHPLIGVDAATVASVGAASLSQAHTLSSGAVAGMTQVSQPEIDQIHSFAPEPVQSSPQVTEPTFEQVHSLAPASVEVSTSVSTPTVGQVHGLIANGVSAASIAPDGLLSSSGQDVLAPDPVQSSSFVSAPSIDQVHSLTASDVESTVVIGVPALDVAITLGSPGVGTASRVSQPALGQAHSFTPLDVAATSQISLPDLSTSADVVVLTPNSVAALCELTAPNVSVFPNLVAPDPSPQMPSLSGSGGSYGGEVAPITAQSKDEAEVLGAGLSIIIGELVA